MNELSTKHGANRIINIGKHDRNIYGGRDRDPKWGIVFSEHTSDGNEGMMSDFSDMDRDESEWLWRRRWDGNGGSKSERMNRV
jgi:hypothetical protein